MHLLEQLSLVPKICVCPVSMCCACASIWCTSCPRIYQAVHASCHVCVHVSCAPIYCALCPTCTRHVAHAPCRTPLLLRVMCYVHHAPYILSCRQLPTYGSSSTCFDLAQSLHLFRTYGRGGVAHAICPCMHGIAPMPERLGLLCMP